MNNEDRPTPRFRRAHRLAAIAATTGLIGAYVAIALANPAAATTGSQDYTTPGSHTFVVPSGVTSITVVAEAGAGASATCCTSVAAGLGGRETATIAVTPGESLDVVVGGAASGSTGGSNGGGDAGAVGSEAGGGGGASDVRQGGTALADRVVVAGGGGGGARYKTGGAGGGVAGQDGAFLGGTGGAAGTTTAGGVGGHDEQTMGAVGGTGALGTGGAGGAGSSEPGAGGGGGYFGGGGGGGGQIDAGGGGGGANYAEVSATGVVSENGINSGDGSVALSWTIPTTTTTTAPPTTTTQPPTTTTPPATTPAPVHVTCPTWPIRVERSTIWAVPFLRWLCHYTVSVLHNRRAVAVYVIPPGWRWAWTVNPH